MRIAYVYDAVFPWETGGVQKRLWEVGRRLATRHDVHWYGLKYWDGPSVIEREGMTIHGVMRAPELYVGGKRSIPEALAFSARLVDPFRRETFDVIDCQEFPFFPVFPSKVQSVLRRTPLVLTWHEVWGDYWYEYLGRKGAFGKVIERVTASLPDVHVAVSERTREDLRGIGVTEAELVPNGISMAEIEAVPAATRPVDVLYVGRLIPEKGADLFVRAVAELRTANRDVRGVVVGDGPERARLKSTVASRGLEANVTFTGVIDNYADVLALMKAASVFVLPSRREGFGISALEALACGTPVVTIDHRQNAAAELVVDGETGAVCAPNPAAIAAAVRRVSTAVSSTACTVSARKYEWNRITALTENVYSNLARGHPPSGSRGSERFEPALR